MQTWTESAKKPSFAPANTSVLQRKCSRCREKEKILQRSAVGSAPDTVPPIVHGVLRSPGQPMDAATRAFMEPRFGYDFSRVRVHTDSKASESAQAVNALAYTVSPHLVFRSGQYTPHTESGRGLLAHELTHIVQQADSITSGITLKPMGVSQPDDRYELEANRIADMAMGTAKSTIPVTVAQRGAPVIIYRQNIRETAAVLHTGTVIGSGLQFFPMQIVSTQIGPVSGSGGLAEDNRDRLSVIVGQSMTLRRIAGLLLPLWNSATPFTPEGAANPIITPPLSSDILARGLLVYNQYYLRLQTQPVPSIKGWQGGLRFPLPVEIDVNGNGIVNKDLIRSLAAGFINAWEPLLDQPATAVVASSPVDLQKAVADFLISHPNASERGIALAARTITNPVEAKPFVEEAISQLGANSFDVALEFMDTLVNSQITLLASQKAGASILGIIRSALANPPIPLSANRQESLNRANHMLGLIAAITPRDMPFIQPSAVSAAGLHMIANFEGFCPNTYDDDLANCRRGGRGNCTIGFGTLIHIGPCSGAPSEARFAGGITRLQGEQLFHNELTRFENMVHNQARVPLSQEQFDALASFAYNHGNINALLPDLNNRRFANIPAIMNQYIRGRVGGGLVVMRGLINRRAAEAQLFTTGRYPPP